MSQRQQVRLLCVLSVILAIGVGYRWWLMDGPGRSSLAWIGASVSTKAQAAKLPTPKDADAPAPQETKADVEKPTDPSVDETPVGQSSSDPGALDLNAATQQQLEQLPGIGPVLARSILDERDRRGGFQCVEDLLSVKGIGPARYARIAPLVCVVLLAP